MKKIDKLLLRAFVGPFFMTFLVVVFILLCQHMLKYFDDIIGKGLGAHVITQLLFYFAVFMTPLALPLSILIASLITFGNLGEHFELTAIKSTGSSLTRILRPIFVFVLFTTVAAFYINNTLVPVAAREAYSLLYDIQKKKPAINLQEGSFYNGIPDISIKVDKKFEDGVSMKNIILYDHRKDNGNTEVIIADSARMFTMLGEQYLKFELFYGYNYSDNDGQANAPKKNGMRSMTRSRFEKNQMVMDLSAIQLIRTDKDLFQNYRMKDLSELDSTATALSKQIASLKQNHEELHKSLFQIPQPSVSEKADQPIPAVDSLFSSEVEPANISASISAARHMKSAIQKHNQEMVMLTEILQGTKIQWHKILAHSFACLVMFLIGGPLGSIIKKGGLGMPFLIAIQFFIAYYIISIQSEKLAMRGLIDPITGAWAANGILLIIGLFLVGQAQRDARLFDLDAYHVFFYQFRRRWMTFH